MRIPIISAVILLGSIAAAISVFLWTLTLPYQETITMHGEFTANCGKYQEGDLLSIDDADTGEAISDASIGIPQPQDGACRYRWAGVEVPYAATYVVTLDGYSARVEHDRAQDYLTLVRE